MTDNNTYRVCWPTAM